jgi:hypothetical protein
VKKGPALSFDTSREGLEAHIDDMTKKLERLRGSYESFFMGVDRAPPEFLRRDLHRQLVEMQQVPIGNSALRFRFQALSQRWVQLTTYWNRVLREIEMGTYSRDLAKAQRRLAQKGDRAITEQEALAMGIPANRVKSFVAHQQELQSRAKGQPSAAAPPPLPGLSESDLQEAYARFMDAHRRMGSDASAPSLEKIRTRLGAQLPQILANRQWGRVTLEVAVDGGKVRLRAKPMT